MAQSEQIDELREIADWFRLRGDPDNAKFMDGAADTISASMDFLAWFNKTYPGPSANELHPWNRFSVALLSAKGPVLTDEERADCGLLSELDGD